MLLNGEETLVYRLKIIYLFSSFILFYISSTRGGTEMDWTRESRGFGKGEGDVISNI